MREGSQLSDKRGRRSSTPSMDSITKQNTGLNRGFFGRRKTIKDMKRAFSKTKGKQKFLQSLKYEYKVECSEISQY